jgi:VCBS repeat-containing protein
VDNVNISPLVADNIYKTPVNTLLSVPVPGVLINDIDVFGGAITATALTTPAHGALTLNANGSFTYNPAANYIGSDAFIYQASDGANALGTAWVNLSVTATPNSSISANPPPQIQSVRLVGGHAVVTWTSVSDRNYRLQYKGAISNTNWTDISPDVTASGPTASATDNATSAHQRFYRVLLLP